jgi:MATE family multidrug resistance protein
MRSRRYDREILALAVPALGALAADPLVSLIDTAFVGRLGPVPLAALGVNVAVFSFAFVVFNFLAYGTTPMVGRAFGRGDRDAAGRVVANAFALAVVVGLLALAALQLLAVPILRLMGAGEELLGPATGYLRIRALAGPALLLITAANGAFRGYQDTRTPLVVTVGVAVFNLVLDPLFIFGFGWGLIGAAWATTLAQWAGAATFVALVYGRLRARWRVPLALPRLAELAPFLRVGWALLIRTFALIGAMTAATAVATRVGVLEVAAHQVAAQLWMFLALIVDALAIAAQALVARYVGEGRPDAARAVSDRLLVLGLGVGVALGVAFWLARPWLPGLFSDDPAVVRVVLSLFPFVAVMQPLNALVFVWDGIFMGIEDFSFLAVAMVLSAAVAALLLASVLPFGWGLHGVWWALVGLMLARAATLAWRYRPAAGVFRRAT